MEELNIKIVIIEDDHILRQSYEHLINVVPNYLVVNAYPSFDEARKHLEADDPNVILLDIELPGINGIDAIPIIKKMVPGAYIIMLTVYEFEDQIFSALTNGASGYLIKTTPIQRILESIHEVMDGGGPMSAHIASMVIRSFQKNEDSPLSKRETQILEKISQAKNRKEIANELFIDTETVKSHLRNIYTKLHVNSKSDALKEARKKKLI